MTEQQFKNRGPKSEWNLVKTFEDGDLVVQVSRSKPPRGPAKFSMQPGVKRRDGQGIVSHIGVFQTDDPSAVVFKRDYAAVLGYLLTEAQAYIKAELESDWALWLKERIEREQRFVAVGGGRDGKPQQTFRKGKTARDKGKKGGGKPGK